MMRKVCLCTTLGFLAQCYYFGYGTVLQVLLCIGFSVLCEALILRLRRQDIKFALSDYTAILTGLLLGLSLPAYTPWWIAFTGSFFCIGVVKQLYGGLGNNIFNPAMMGYTFLVISFPLQMTQWPLPTPISEVDNNLIETFRAIFLEQKEWLTTRQSIDGITMATPLDTLKSNLTQDISIADSLQQPIFNEISGVGWSVINLGYLVGGLIMLKMNIIRWHISTAFLVSLSLCAVLGYLIHPESAASPWFHLFSGATMYGAFFIATDPVSTSSTQQGQLIFGALIGVLIYVIRTYGGYPDAVAFAVILANLCAPLIDHFLHPTTYGHKRV